MFAWALLLALPWEVEWDVPEGCPSEAEFVAKVETEARIRAETEAAEVLTADVRIEQRSAQRWELVLQISRGDEVDTRSFDGDSCAAVVEAAALIVSLRLVEWVMPEQSEPAPEAPVELEPPPPLPMTAEETAAEPESTPDPFEPSSSQPVFELGGWLGLHGGLALGVAPGLGGAVGIEGGLTGRWWRAGMAVQAMPRRSHRHPNRSSVVGRFDLVQAELFGCGSPAIGPVEFPVCGRLAGGGLRASGEGDVTRSEPAWGAWWGLGGSAGLAWHVTDHVAPALSAEALAPLRDWSFSVGSVPGTLYRTGLVAFRAWVGLEIHL